MAAAAITENTSPSSSSSEMSGVGGALIGRRVELLVFRRRAVLHRGSPACFRTNFNQVV